MLCTPYHPWHCFQPLALGSGATAESRLSLVHHGWHRTHVEVSAELAYTFFLAVCTEISLQFCKCQVQSSYYTDWLCTFLLRLWFLPETIVCSNGKTKNSWVTIATFQGEEQHKEINVSNFRNSLVVAITLPPTASKHCSRESHRSQPGILIGPTIASLLVEFHMLFTVAMDLPLRTML